MIIILTEKQHQWMFKRPWWPEIMATADLVAITREDNPGMCTILKQRPAFTTALSWPTNKLPMMVGDLLSNHQATTENERAANAATEPLEVG